MEQVKRYLRIPPRYSHWLDGLRWADTGEAIEYADGTTFLLAQEIALFLEGFAATHRLIHFGHVLHLLKLLGHGRGPRPEEVSTLVSTYERTGKQVRNAGFLCGYLCRSFPPVAEPIEIKHLHGLLANPMKSIYWVSWIGEVALSSSATIDDEPPQPLRVVEPALTPREFEIRFLEVLKDVPARLLESLLRHCHVPVEEAGEQLAQEVITLQPRSLSEALELLAQRQRFAGAAPFVAQLVSALALPPRRLAHRELPLGGYADVTTRGQPEQILPSQFAVDDLEFVRRFAANELLYFHREEPHAQTREELVLLLDQGVRTWGSVRLVLGAAVLAFGKRAVRRSIPFRVAATSSAGAPVDPRQVNSRQLGELLEVSDLTPHPGAALERLLETPTETDRDIVLLSHPRNLEEIDVGAAARRVMPNTRLFAVTIDDRGNGQLAEMKHGTPVRLSQFRVDMNQALTPPEQPEERQRHAASSWSGDVEAIGFPFRFGIMGQLVANGFDFDGSSEWLLTASTKGMLHAWRVDGSGSEVLPRAWVLGEVFTQVEAVLGVAGGFVVAGQVQKWLVAIHYDFTRRKVRAYVLGPAVNLSWKWFYFPELHSIVAREGALTQAVDLDTGGQYPHRDSSPALITRAVQACSESHKYVLPPPRLFICPTYPTPALRGPHLYLDHENGRLLLGNMDSSGQPFTPISDGQTMLKGQRIIEAQCSGNTLAVVLAPIRGPDTPRLRLFRVRNGIPLSELPYEPKRCFTLSSDGRLLARQIGSHWWEIRQVLGGINPLLRTGPGRCHSDLAVELGDMWMTIQVGRTTRLLRWDQNELKIVSTTQDRKNFLREELVNSSLRESGIAARLSPELPSELWYDRQRFRAGAKAEVWMLVDVYGQIAVFDQLGDLVAMFFVIRKQLAAWMPDGTRYGPANLTGGPETPGALVKIGTALRQATERGKRMVP
jgi:hypothetical protein